MQTQFNITVSFFIDTHKEMHHESKRTRYFCLGYIFIKIIIIIIVCYAIVAANKNMYIKYTQQHKDDFKHSFTGTLSNKFAIKLSLKSRQTSGASLH